MYVINLISLGGASFETAFSAYVLLDHTLDDENRDDYEFRVLDVWLYVYQMRDKTRKSLSCSI